MIQPTNADLRIEIAVIKKDLDAIKRDVDEIKAELRAIRGYVVKAILGIGGVVGIVLVRWVIMGGLSGGL